MSAARLRRWEREYPLSKISGDFIIKEVRYHRARQDWPRVRVLVEAYCRENLAAYKIPREIEFLAELPKSSVLKVLRRELRDMEMAKRGG